MRTWRGAGAVLLSVVGLVGCGGGGPKTYRLTGKVTFAGKPVEMGRIYFDPDAVGGNGGPSGYADIVDGEFDTAAANGKGVVGGPMVVRIQGHKKEPADRISGYGPRLFEEYTVKVDLPRAAGSRDFEVPAAAAKGLPKN